MKFIKYLFYAAFLLSASSVSAKLLKTYSGTHYDMNTAYSVAKYKAPGITCIFTNEPGTFPMPWDQKCSNSAIKKIAFINPRTKQAFKFSVQSIATDNGGSYVEIKQISFTNIERQAVNDLYQIHTDIKDAVSRVNFNPLTLQSNNTSFSHFTKAFSTSLSSAQCTEHPTSYFTPKGQRKTHNKLAKDIKNELGSSTWFDYFEDTDFSGGGIQLGKGNFGLNISLHHINHDVFTSVSFGDPDYNLLVFKVHYNGDMRVDGKRKLNLRFELQRGSSAIDGIEISRLFTDDPDVVIDLSKIAVSNCFLDFIKNNGTPHPSTGGPTGGGGPIGGGGSVCTERLNAYTCSTASDGSTKCSKQVFIVPRSC